MVVRPHLVRVCGLRATPVSARWCRCLAGLGIALGVAFGKLGRSWAIAFGPG